MQNLILYLKSWASIFPLLKETGMGITVILVLGSLGYGYLQLLTKRAEISPELLRARGEMEISIARADAIRAKKTLMGDTIHQKAP